MGQVLDVAPLRSLVAIADCGGFQIAAEALHLSQSAVSQHVRRLEETVGCALVERHGRGSRFTAEGDRMLTHARRLLAEHDEALHAFGVGSRRTLTIGSTEHAAAQLLPPLAEALERVAPATTLRFRVDRGAKLREGLSAGRVDLALLLESEDPRGVPVGELALDWYAAPGWVRATGEPVPLVAIDAPCALRTRALQTLADHHVPVAIGAEANQLAGVLAAAGAGLGVALLATLGQTPSGLVAYSGLPPADPLRLVVCSRKGRRDPLATAAAKALRRRLSVASLAS